MIKLQGIVGNNIELTPAMEAYVTKCVAKLSKIVQNREPATVRVELGKPSSHYRKGEDVQYAEFHVTIQDKDFSARKTDASVYKAIEKVRVDLYRQIATWKTKERHAVRKQGAIIKKLYRSNGTVDS